MRVFFSPRYSVPLPGHVFVPSKFSLAVEELLRRGLIRPDDLFEPEPASRDELLLVHSPAWVDKALQGRLTPEDAERLELPWSPALVEAHRIHARGTIEACREALRTGLGLHAGGGSHHAFPAHGEGYCLFNDLALGVRSALAEGRLRRAAVVDLDVHQGNGTAAAFAGDPRVFTFSMHQESNYPASKTYGTMDVGLEDGAGDEAYLEALRRALPRVLDESGAELVVYQAGVDPYEKDQLGGLRLTEGGLRERDRTVFREAFRRGQPVAVTLGGGYAADPGVTARLHANTMEEALRLHRRLWRAHEERKP